MVILDDTLGYPLLNHNGNGNDEVPEACDWYVSPHIYHIVYNMNILIPFSESLMLRCH